MLDNCNGSADSQWEIIPPACDPLSPKTATPKAGALKSRNSPSGHANSAGQPATTKITTFKTAIERGNSKNIRGTLDKGEMGNEAVSSYLYIPKSIPSAMNLTSPQTRNTDVNSNAAPFAKGNKKDDEKDDYGSGRVKFSSVSGTTLVEWTTVADVFRPHIFSRELNSSISRRYKGLNLLRQSPGVERLEVVKLWKGLSWDAAETLLFWEKIFARVLLCWLEGNLGDFDQYWGTSRYLPVCLDQIMDGMLVLARETAFSSQAFSSFQNCRKTLSQFIRTHECFVPENTGRDNGPGRLVVGVKIRKADIQGDATQARPIRPAKAIAEVIWNMNYITFADFERHVVEGREFRLVPKFVSLTNNSYAHFSIEYSSPATWLHWCPDFGGFIGVVPFYSDEQEQFLHPNPTIIRSAPRSSDKTYILQFIITAVVTEMFGGNVRLEQKVNSRVSLRVTSNPPPKAAGQHAATSTQGEEELPWPENLRLNHPGITMEEYQDYQNQVNQTVGQVPYPTGLGIADTSGPYNITPPGGAGDDIVRPESPFFVQWPVDVQEDEYEEAPKSLFRQFMTWKRR